MSLRGAVWRATLQSMLEPDNIRHFETVVNAPLGEAAVASLEEFLAAVKDGRVVAYAIVAKEAGYARWSSWRAPIVSDRYNILGQLAALTSEVAKTLGSDAT